MLPHIGPETSVEAKAIVKRVMCAVALERYVKRKHANREQLLVFIICLLRVQHVHRPAIRNGVDGAVVVLHAAEVRNLAHSRAQGKKIRDHVIHRSVRHHVQRRGVRGVPVAEIVAEVRNLAQSHAPVLWNHVHATHNTVP